MLGLAVVAPYLIHKPIYGNYSAVGADKHLEHLKLLVGEAVAAGGALELERGAVEREIAELQRGGGLRRRGARHGADAREQLLGRKGLGEIVVRPAVEALDLVVNFALRREEQEYALLLHPIRLEY